MRKTGMFFVYFFFFVAKSGTIEECRSQLDILEQTLNRQLKILENAVKTREPGIADHSITNATQCMSIKAENPRVVLYVNNAVGQKTAQYIKLRTGNGNDINCICPKSICKVELQKDLTSGGWDSLTIWATVTTKAKNSRSQQYDVKIGSFKPSGDNPFIRLAISHRKKHFLIKNKIMQH